MPNIIRDIRNGYSRICYNNAETQCYTEWRRFCVFLYNNSINKRDRLSWKTLCIHWWKHSF